MASFTRKAIIESFLKLLNERPLNKITIKDIVEDCGINRNSFYYHFEDMSSLVEEIMVDEADKIIEQYGDISSLEECLGVAIDFAVKNKKAVMHIYSSASREAYERYLNRVSEYVVTKYIDTFVDIPAQEEDKQIIIKFFKCELTGYILDWMSDGMRYDIRNQVGRICELFEDTTRIAFERSAGKH
ncbi:TetR/AcrR family transcriptional regulator [Anaerocolumna sp.]|uniref:TetR/AcrR family transcriptional regulator n=1 Tax=Anaerocolumna sp. TaxID=2041569 RepID=UPI0028ADC056|nr:TetR/AcrR family transcriptional regulator [Anaerocolumna sp.]